MPLKHVVVPTLAALVVFAAFYALPNLLEFWLLDRMGPFVAICLVGDVVGCAAVAAIHWKTGVALYVGLTVIENLLLWTHAVRPAALIWWTDLVPALVLAAIAAVVVAVVRGSESWPNLDPRDA